MAFEQPAGRQRADAQRSRARLLKAAGVAFAETENPTFKDIAKSAAVGIGTMYRHFPTRESLVAAVYFAELTHLCDSAGDLLTTMPADQALRTWMGRWSSFVATKRGMADALQGLVAAGTVTKSDTGPRLTAAIQHLLDAGVKDGTLRSDISASDVTAALTGTLVVAGSTELQDQAQRLLDLLMDGLTAPLRR